MRQKSEQIEARRGSEKLQTWEILLDPFAGSGSTLVTETLPGAIASRLTASQ